MCSKIFQWNLALRLHLKTYVAVKFIGIEINKSTEGSGEITPSYGKK